MMAEEVGHARRSWSDAARDAWARAMHWVPEVPRHFHPTADELYSFLGLDAFFGLLCYVIYKNCKSDYNSFKKCAEISISSDLKNLINAEPNKQIPYACVTGFTSTQDVPLKSFYQKGEVGVLQSLSINEYLSLRTSNGYWSDSTRNVRSHRNAISFELAENKDGSGQRVEVREPLAADGLSGSMKTTYVKFLPNSNNFVDRIMDRISGNISKGFQENEEMLGLGVKLFGVGRLVLEDNTIRLEPPGGGHTYYLTTQSKSDILERLGDRVSLSGALVIVTGAFGLGLLSVIAFRQYRVWRQQSERREMARTVREMREARERQGTPLDRNAADLQQTCVVCLENPREVVILNCGHICTCLACLDLIPSPQKCPVCRQNIERVVPVFVP